MNAVLFFTVTLGAVAAGYALGAVATRRDPDPVAPDPDVADGTDNAPRPPIRDFAAVGCPPVTPADLRRARRVAAHSSGLAGSPAPAAGEPSASGPPAAGSPRTPAPPG